MIYTHNVGLGLAAVVVSIVAAITGLVLLNNVGVLPESRRKAVIVMAAFLLGGGIWSMHFLAMLSMQFQVPIHYDLLQTLGSGLVAILVVGFALLLLHFRARSASVINTAGLCVGIGIISMHVVGMLGMRGVIPEFNIAALSFALILALVMGVAAIRVSYRSRSRENIVKGGVLFGLSVVVVHYTAMIDTQFSVDPDYQALSIALNQGALAIAVTVAVFVICGTFLLVASTFVSSVKSVPSVYEPQAIAAVAAQDSLPTRPAPTAPVDVQTPVPAELEVAVAEQQTTYDADEEPAQKAVSTEASRSLPVKIPYEQQKHIFFIQSDQVGAIRADGRYTQLYTREGVKFCPWSITEAQKRLSEAQYYRSHRSYLINIQAVKSFEKNRDSGVCHFEGFTQLSGVPVSRARVDGLIAQLGL